MRRTEMRIIAVFVVLIVFGKFVYAQVEHRNITFDRIPDRADSGFYFVLAEQMPVFEYKNCNSSNHCFLMYVTENFEFPSGDCFGKMVFRFFINPDGSIENVILINGLGGCPEYKEEAVRIISEIPEWKPGKMGEKAVKVLMTMPINVDP